MIGTLDNWRRGLLPVSVTLRDAIVNLNESSLKIVLIVNQQGQLQGTVSDGDIRRGLLGAASLDSPIVEVLHTNPLVVPEGMEKDLVLQIMGVNKIQQLTLLYKNKLVIILEIPIKLMQLMKKLNKEKKKI